MVTPSTSNAGSSSGTRWPGSLPANERWRGPPAGWVSSSTIAWYATEDDSVALTSLDGTVVRRVQLQADPELRFVDQSGTQISPDGSRLAVLENSDGTDLRDFSLATGEELPMVARDSQVQHPGPPVWQGDHVLWWDEVALVDPASGATVVELSDRWLRSGIVVWSPVSAAGPAHDGPTLLDWRYWPFWWWWKQILGVLGGLVVVAAIWRLDLRDRRKFRAGT